MLSGPDFADTANMGTRVLTYNMDNMPTQITYTKGASTTVSQFTYDGAGTRALKAVAGGSTTYYVNPNYEVKDGVVTKYIAAADQKIAQIKGTAVAYYHKDHLNSSTVMTNAAGVKAEGTEYAPYGTLRARTGDVVSNYRYTGKELDTETGLYNYGVRYYEPMIGRFITPDPALSMYIPLVNNNRRLPNGGVFNPVTLNLYAYANNNPMKYVDPNGLWAYGVHYKMTKDWATDYFKGTDAGRAEKIADANSKVDDFMGGKNMLPLFGEQSWHFNTNSSGDARIDHMNACLDMAVALQHEANILNRSGFTSEANEYTKQADAVFGEGMHALQDIFAHSDKYVHSTLGIKWHSLIPNPNDKWQLDADNVEVDPNRILRTEKASRLLFEEYLKRTGNESANGDPSKLNDEIKKFIEEQSKE